MTIHGLMMVRLIWASMTPCRIMVIRLPEPFRKQTKSIKAKCPPSAGADLHLSPQLEASMKPQPGEKFNLVPLTAKEEEEMLK